MCICGLKRIIFRNGTLKNCINTGRYTADYLQRGNLPYLAGKKHMTVHILSYRRIRRYLALSLKATEEHVTLVMWDPLSGQQMTMLCIQQALVLQIFSIRERNRWF